MSFLKVRSVKALYLSLIISFNIIVFMGIQTYSETLFGPEYQIKAAFIYNFAKFIEWPEEILNRNNNNSVTLCIIPDNPESDIFFSLNNRTVGGKRMEVKKISNIKDIDGCHILFVDSTDKAFIKECLKGIKDRSILTVGHFKGFIREGGIINFFTEEGKLRFEVNLNAAKNSGIKLGSQLLMSAEIVTSDKE